MSLRNLLLTKCGFAHVNILLLVRKEILITLFTCLLHVMSAVSPPWWAHAVPFWHGLPCVACCHELIKTPARWEMCSLLKWTACFLFVCFCTVGFKGRRGHQWQQVTFLHFYEVLSNVKSNYCTTWIKLPLVDYDDQCLCRCCCLRWCVVGRENGKLLGRIYSAAGGNGSTGEHMFFVCECMMMVLVCIL